MTESPTAGCGETPSLSRHSKPGDTGERMPGSVEIVAEGLAFPEGPVIMADGSVIVVEIAGGRVTRCWEGRKETICEIGGGPNGAAIGPDGALYVCNNGGMDAATMQSANG